MTYKQTVLALVFAPLLFPPLLARGDDLVEVHIATTAPADTEHERGRDGFRTRPALLLRPNQSFH